jgi:hypothetical protein
MKETQATFRGGRTTRLARTRQALTTIVVQSFFHKLAS